MSDALTGRDEFGSPEEYLNRVETVAMVVQLPSCEHCEETRELRPMHGGGWAVEHFHEPHCPEHEDNQPS